MSLLDDLPEGVVIGLDTAPLIYFIEGHDRYGPVMRPLFEERTERGLNEAVTPVVSLAEVLVQPLATGHPDLVQRYRDLLLQGPHLILPDLTPQIAETAADLRARYRIRLPDAFQLATALERNASHFITNDVRFRRVTELRVLILEDYLPPANP
jgi:predicted nucleic acid-binding protein